MTNVEIVVDSCYDAADVMGELPETKAEEVIGLLEDEEQASDIRDLLNYEDGTAGALMAKELVPRAI